MTDADSVRRLKTRYVVLAILFAWYWIPEVTDLFVNSENHEWYWISVADQYCSHIANTILIVVIALITRVNPQLIIGRELNSGDISPIFRTTIFAYLASTAIIVFVFVPVSYLLPDCTTWWLRWAYWPIVYADLNGTLSWQGNFLGFVSLVILAPLLEELLFRGYLLQAWARKWGLRIGVLLSSVLFGALHPDTLAAAFTGFCLAILYLKTQSLWAPIVAHSIFNLAVWLQEFYGVATTGIDYYVYTVEQFRNDWWYGGVAFIVIFVWSYRILTRDDGFGLLTLPSVGRRDT